MARKSNAAKLIRKVASRKRKKAAPRKNAALVSNPGVAQDLVEQVVPGLVAYAALRVIGRIAYKIARRKSPRWAKHAGAIVPVIAGGAGWLAVHKMDSLKPYHDAYLVGASIATVQSVMQTYMPQWGWFLNDYHLDDVLPMAQQQPAKKGKRRPAASAQSQDAGQEDYEDEEDLDDTSDLDEDDYSDIPGMGGSFKQGIFA